VQIVGDHQSLITEELDQLRFSPGLGAVVEGRDFSKLGADEKWGYAAMHRHIFEVIRDGVPCLNGLAEGYRGVELIEACHRSARGGGEIIPLESKERVPRTPGGAGMCLSSSSTAEAQPRPGVGIEAGHIHAPSGTPVKDWELQQIPWHVLLAFQRDDFSAARALRWHASISSTPR